MGFAKDLGWDRSSSDNRTYVNTHRTVAISSASHTVRVGERERRFCGPANAAAFARRADKLMNAWGVKRIDSKRRALVLRERELAAELDEIRRTLYTKSKIDRETIRRVLASAQYTGWRDPFARDGAWLEHVENVFEDVNRCSRKMSGEP